MPLPSPTRDLPDTFDTGPPGPSGGDYADKVAAEVEALWDRIINVLTNIGGSADAITADVDPATIHDFVHGQQFWLVPAANNTGGVTVDIDSRGAVDLVAYDGSPLVADDLVAGEGVAFAYDGSGSPPANEMRLMHPTARQLLAIAGAGGAQAWEQIGDSGPLGTVAQVEFTFTPDRYGHILVIGSDITCSSSPATLNNTLRNSTTAIVTLTFTNATTATNPMATRAEYNIGVVAATKRHHGAARGAASAVLAFAEATGSNATSPDRVRFAPSSGNFTSGRVMAYGLVADAS